MSMSLFRIGSNGTLNPKDEKKILDDTEQPLKRYKCLASFNKDGADTELRAFYQKNYSIVYNIFLDTLNSMNSEAKKKSKTIPTSDVLGLTDILLNLFAHSSNIIQKKWQQRSIIHTLELLLDEQNIFQIRFKGFELIVRFVDIMQDNVDNQVLDMIMNALKFKPLTEDSRDIKLPSFGQRALNTDEKLAVATSTNDLTVEEDYQLFTFFFTFMKESDHFDYWWKFFKLRLAPIFYPNECKSLDLLNKMDDMGFTEKAPTRIHLLILDVIMSGLESPKNSTILYQSDKDIYLFLMIFRQSFLLPPQHYEQLAKMMKTYRSWICRDYFLYNWPEIMERNRNLYFRIFIDNLSQIFYMKGDEQYIDLHITMSYEVLEMFMFFTQISDKIDFETWSDLLSAHKRICSTVVDRKTKGGDNYDVMYSDILEKTCFRNLYIIWIKSHPTDQYPKLWEELYELMQSYAHMPSAFGLWRATVLNLARIVCEQIFEMPTDRMRVGFIEYTTDMYTVTVVKKKAKTEKKQHIFQGMDTYMSKSISIDTVLHLFHKFLNMFGNENTQLTNGALHAKKMVVLKEVLDLFLDIEITEVKAVRGSTNSVTFLHSPEGNKLFAILLEWIIEACDRTDDQFESGRVIAYTMMCQILVTQFSQPLNVQYLANCYRALFKGLVPEYTATDRTIEAIIKHGWNIFSMGHMGLNILVPYFVQACQKVLKESSATIGPETQELRIAAVQGLTSLIPICYFYGDRPLPHVETVLKLKQAKLENLNPETVTTFTKLRGRIVQTLQSCVQDDRFVDVQIKCIWGLYAILHNELQLEGVNGRSNPSRQIVEMFIKFFVDKNADVACAAHDAVVTLAHLGLFTKLGVPTIRTFLLTICTALSSQLKDSDSALAQWSIFKHLFYSIVEILQYIPMKVLESKEVASMLFSAINRGLSVVSLSVLLTPQKDTVTEAATEDSADRGAKMYSFENYTLSKEDSALEIATAAESLLCYALNVFSQFPTPIGAARMSTEISEFDVLQEENGLYVTSPKVHHFVFNNYTLLTIMENPNKTESCVVILRDMTGKYCWEFKQVYSPETMTFKKDNMVRIDHLEFDELVDDESKSGAKNSNAPRASKAGFDSPGSPEEDRASFYVSSIVNRGDEELFDADDPRAEPIVRQDLAAVDLPADIDQTGGLKVDKESFETPDIKVPVTAQQETKEDSDDDEENHEEEEAIKVEEQESQMAGDEGAEELDYPHYDIEIDTDKTDMLEVLQHYVTQDTPALGFNEAHAPKKPDYENDNLTKSVHKAFRSLLNNIGFLSGTSRASFSLVNANGRFYRSLKQLDKLTERETIKVGLIYVANQQEAQKDILKNDETSGSRIYKEFVQSLGWDADMRTHGGFMGGLDENLTTGNTAPYYSNATTEVIFHDVTRMPTKVNDSQQIQKKRHVGNDFVHIVWSEHDRDYKPWTIPSQFNFVHICVYPYQRHKETYLFRVRIYTKPEVPLFGPLLDGMIVDKKNLGPLVRMTAINANKAVRYKQKQYRKPFPTRRSHINEIIQRHKAQSTSNIDFIKTFFLDQDYMSVEFNPKKPLAPIASTSPNTTESSDTGSSGSSTPNSRNVRNSRASIKKSDIKPEVSSPTQKPTTTANTPQQQQQQQEEVEEQVEYEYVDENGEPITLAEGEEVEYIEVEEEEYQ
ncbi:hypothetical protein NAEGRDRAFT_81714 [Naegleria gruberi]|uniref:Uncharacterized protein AM11 n=1 Tax=Naegleria gruberi TaxID=5762 RepID=D2VYJ1_NAEGR|nr:uncharacterized protein NAEGRDRAFT_81714 [Naegleria gruberi]EFC38122.1 hypothetical protein NAEGRDRAFT_81714 [Naegleria gruberi]|eukprot:XP_002670866.1 hypothetical protein NAEGRDRAFT_81714 [Naegleria gruberi strain NEG-M]